MRETLNIGKPNLKLRQDFQHPSGLMNGARTFGDLGGIQVGAMNNSE
jgi:hypothetical protein